MVDVTAPGLARPAAKPVFSEGYKRTVLTTLTLVYALNFIDRTIISIIGQPMKESLGITDNQLGLLGGLAFALLYTVLGVPIARFFDTLTTYMGSTYVNDFNILGRTYRVTAQADNPFRLSVRDVEKPIAPARRPSAVSSAMRRRSCSVAGSRLAPRSPIT